MVRDETWALHGEHSNESPECFARAFTLGREGALTPLRVLRKRWKLLVSRLDFVFIVVGVWIDLVLEFQRQDG